MCYDGFEPSGRIHIAQGLLRAHNTNKLTASGVKFVFYVADYFALLNLKMGGDLKKIKECGEYFIEIWKSCGMNLENVEFVWASEFIERFSDKYWFNVLQISLRNSIARIKRCGQIMGRSASDELMSSQILYPIMQANDVFMLKCDMTSLGLDQRKVNVLAREFCKPANNIDGALNHLMSGSKMNKPVVLSHHMLGALTGDNKMSKSKPNSAIFMEDSAKDVARKIKKAYCPEKLLKETIKSKDPKTGEEIETVKVNGCVEYVKYIVIPMLGEIQVKLESTNDVKTFKDYEEFEKEYVSGNIHPSCLKSSLTDAINKLLDPVREHFKKNARAKELLGKMKQYAAEKANKGKKKSKNKKKGGGSGKPVCLDIEDDDCMTSLEMKVGMMKPAKKISDTLYLEQVDVGEKDGDRQILSKLVGRVDEEKMQGLCVVATNLKARKIGSDKSFGMILAAESADGQIGLLRPPAGSKPGDLVVVEDLSYDKYV